MKKERKIFFFPSPFPYQSPGEILENSAFFQLTTAPQKGRGKGQRKKKRDTEEMEEKGAIS